jgi:hypothetical protein
MDFRIVCRHSGEQEEGRTVQLKGLWGKPKSGFGAIDLLRRNAGL